MTQSKPDKQILEMISDIAHCGGLVGLSESDALRYIRRLTLNHFDRNCPTKIGRQRVEIAINFACNLKGETQC